MRSIHNHIPLENKVEHLEREVEQLKLLLYPLFKVKKKKPAKTLRKEKVIEKIRMNIIQRNKRKGC